MAEVVQPSGLGSAGRRLWASVTKTFEFDGEHEVSLLTQAARTADHIEALEQEVASRGVVLDSPQGLKAHPALVEVRQQRIVLARLLSALRLPDASGKRPQRQRGPSTLRSVKVQGR